jgi:hypothetical protein
MCFVCCFSDSSDNILAEAKYFGLNIRQQLLPVQCTRHSCIKSVTFILYLLNNLKIRHCIIGIFLDQVYIRHQYYTRRGMIVAKLDSVINPMLSRELFNKWLVTKFMTNNREIYTSSKKALIYIAIGETVLITGLPFIFLDGITLKSFSILLLISIIFFAIMYAIEWSRRRIKSVEFVDGKIIILKSITNYQDTMEPKLEIALKSITKCVNKNKTSWNLEYSGNKILKLNLYAFDAEDADKIIAKIKDGMN